MATSDKPPKRVRKGSHKETDPAQSKRFISMARELGGDENAEAFEQKFKKIAGKHAGKSPK